MNSKERHEARYQRRKQKRDERKRLRYGRCDDFDEVFTFDNLYTASRKCCLGVGWKASTQRYKANAQITLSEDEKIEADFTKNKSEYLYHGIDHKVDKKWKRNLLLVINDFWFVIWAIVSCFTIVPVSTFLSRIKALKGVVKGCAVTVGILLLLAILGGITYAILRACGIDIFG